MPVHVYGNPCKIKEIQKIADRYGLRVIYDAAHAFGVKMKKKSILNYGDLSILSFHATKTYSTIEGGAIISHDKKTKERIDYLKNFGFADETTVIAPGINAKMNEVQAAFGLLQLNYVEAYIQKRKLLAEYYREALSNISGITCMYDVPNVSHNYSYFPIFVDKDRYGLSRDELYEKLKSNNIYARRYFYPLISQFPTYSGLPSAKFGNLPVAERIAEKILCLPIYPELNIEHIKIIIKILTR